MKKNIKKAVATKTEANEEKSKSVETTAVVPFTAISMNLRLDMIDPSPYNPRKEFSEQELSELAKSIRMHGLQTDIKVRPMEGGRYQIVYGERRYRASILAGKETIPAKIEQMSDEQAETCAIIENMQRQNFSPFEEGKIFMDKYENGKSITWICETYGKKEEYVRGRMNLTKLIPEVAELLKQKEITLEVAKEFAKYDQNIQAEVYKDHFTAEGYFSWKGIPAKELAKRLYNRYMTKLDSYNFDKTECSSCGHNTFNQVLFTDCGDCAGCQNIDCLLKKNTDYLVNKCIELSSKDPRLHIAVYHDGDRAAANILEEKGYDITEFEAPYWRYTDEPEMPHEPDPTDYEDEDDLQFAMDDYQEELKQFKEAISELEFSVSEGKMLKYAVIHSKDISIVYDLIEEETKENEDGVVYTAKPESPAKELLKKDERNEELCYEHITKDLKKLIRAKISESFPETPITEREQQFLFYVLLNNISFGNLKRMGLDRYNNDRGKYLELAETLTAEQKTMLYRMAIMKYCDDISEYNCKPDNADTRLLTEFADLHFPDESRAVQERHKAVYEKRHENLQTRIKAIEDEAELLRLRELAAANDQSIDVQTGEIIDDDAAEAHEWDYPEPAMPDEPNHDYDPEEYGDGYEFIPDEAAELGLPMQERAKGKRKRISGTQYAA